MSSEADVSNVQVERFGQTVVSSAERFYYHGFPSRVLIQETLPGNVRSLAVKLDDNGDSLLVIRMKSGEMRDVFIFPSEVKMLGDLRGEEVASPGVKNVRIFTSPEVGGNIPFVTVNMGDGSCEVPVPPGSRIDHSVCYYGQLCFNGVLMDFCSLCRSKLSGANPNPCSSGYWCQPDESCGNAIPPVVSSPPVVTPPVVTPPVVTPPVVTPPVVTPPVVTPPVVTPPVVTPPVVTPPVVTPPVVTPPVVTPPVVTPPVVTPPVVTPPVVTPPVVTPPVVTPPVVTPPVVTPPVVTPPVVTPPVVTPPVVTPPVVTPPVVTPPVVTPPVYRYWKSTGS